MKVLVLFKTVPEMEAMTSEDWLPDSHLRVQTGYVKTVLNPQDESALELALKLRDQGRSTGIPVHLEALTVGSDSPILKTLLALDFDEVTCLEHDSDLTFCPDMVARLVIKWALDCELILTGCRSADGDNGQLPLFLAEWLPRHVLTQVLEISIRPDGFFTTLRLTDSGLLTQVVMPPIIAAIGESPVTYLRVPTLKDRLNSAKRIINRVKVNPESDIADNRPVLKSICPVDFTRGAQILEGDAAEKALVIYQHLMDNKLS